MPQSRKINREKVPGFAGYAVPTFGFSIASAIYSACLICVFPMKAHTAERKRQDLALKAQGQLLSHQPLHQSFRVGEILLPPLRPAIRLRLCQMQRS